jgi:hypothetical protein
LFFSFTFLFLLFITIYLSMEAANEVDDSNWLKVRKGNILILRQMTIITTRLTDVHNVSSKFVFFPLDALNVLS